MLEGWACWMLVLTEQMAWAARLLVAPVAQYGRTPYRNTSLLNNANLRFALLQAREHSHRWLSNHQAQCTLPFSFNTYTLFFTSVQKPASRLAWRPSKRLSKVAHTTSSPVRSCAGRAPCLASSRYRAHHSHVVGSMKRCGHRNRNTCGYSLHHCPLCIEPPNGIHCVDL